MMAVIDASVYVAMFHAGEPGHASSWTWWRRAQYTSESISAPLILIAEVAAALSRGASDPSLAHQVVQQLLRYQVVQLAPITSILAERAAAIAADYRVRGCDSIYIALAEQLDEELITLDQQQLERGAVVVKTRRP
jgi:predicted nucleic acid-binding protein